MKFIPEGSTDVVNSYNILKRSCKAGAISMFFSNWILLPRYFRVRVPIIVFTATSFLISNDISKGLFFGAKGVASPISDNCSEISVSGFNYIVTLYIT